MATDTKRDIWEEVAKTSISYDTNHEVGKRIAEIRRQMKLTQSELASKMSERLGRDIRPLTITRLEGGKRPIGVDEMVAAAQVFGVMVTDLIGPTCLSRAQQVDAARKRLTTPWLAETEAGLELLGLDDQQIERAMADTKEPVDHLQAILPEMVTAKQLAKFLQTTEQSLAQERFLGRGIPFYKIGKRVRYARKDILAYLKQGRIGT